MKIGDSGLQEHIFQLGGIVPLYGLCRFCRLVVSFYPASYSVDSFLNEDFVDIVENRLLESTLSDCVSFSSF